jgi:hypothetical protein
MAKISISEILDDIRTSEEVLQKFERRYWITSEQFFELYSQGLLDNGEYIEDFSEWAGFFKLKQRREQAFQKFSQRRLNELRSATLNDNIQLTPQEPMIEA